MTDKLTDSEIIKALEWHLNNENNCDECPLLKLKNTTTYCVDVLMQNALDLINRLQAENERLQDAIDEQDIEIASLWKRIEDAKAEAYKEFAKKLHEELRMYGTKDKFNKAVFLNVVDKVKKELVGEESERQS